MSLLLCENNCGQEYDPTTEVQCRRCGHELGTPADDTPSTPPPAAAAPGVPTAPEPSTPTPSTRLVITVCGRDFTVADDEQIGLGRDLRFGSIAEALENATNVSRVHAMLRFADGRIYIQDTDSGNGTFIDGVRIPTNQEYEIADGQSLRLAADVPVGLRKES
ncbi:FHA domain-containing protein [Gordonia alkaliphila]|uniref:FHA domain-containing protein n=1 Tax=Gordonia alkaliphila TaxID=1053547 RepID=A0ABP8ZJD1_9ACTN